MMTETKGILNVVESFYQDLYQEKRIEGSVANEISSYITKTIKDSGPLIKDFTFIEMEKALKHFKKGKSPGTDGLSLEFYQTFWDILSEDLFVILNDLDKLNTLPESFRTGVVTLLHKKDDKAELKNWRPITLLNFDMKLFSKLLMQRMSTVLTDLIHPDQACAVPGRKITDSLVLIRDTICYARDRSIRLVVLNLDFEKAFDRVSHQYLFQVLQKMGFPGRFLTWVGLLYREIISRILVNGNLSKAIDIGCGVRQGCPLSPLLYVACIEPLAQILRRDQWIKGLDIPGTGGLTAKTVLYMDDINILCTDILSIKRTMDVTDWFGRASGAKLNRDKTQAQFFGPWLHTETRGLDLTVKATDLKILGVKFDSNGGGSGNWPDLLGKVRQRLGFWRLRQLTLEGKVLIIKTVILPLLLLLCSIFYPPRFFLLALDRAIFYFLWGSKWERLRREVMKRAPEHGGKGVPDPHLVLGAQYTALHIKYATAPFREHKTVAMARFWMGSYLRSLKILKVDLRIPIAFNLPPAYDFIKKFLKHFNLEKENTTVLTNHRSILSVVQEREKVSPVPGLTLGEAERVWREVSHSALQNKHKDLAWMVAHAILPVRVVMHSRGMGKDATCPRPGCGRQETVRHALWECSAARDLWAMAGPLQFPCLPAGGVPDYRMVRGGAIQIKKPPKKEIDLWITINCIKDAIWTSRNLLVGKHVQVSLPATHQLASSRRQEYAVRCHSDVGAGASQGGLHSKRP
ncbi:reverse transcriptase [Triplophysa rosa]|uniref:Reverse transcriptase n=1 Tax=Triplophysa rosa TaxID=992332 RepID=A0A9W7X3H5_TRIRA|nr:reverse transcriptase [Triplophysa rosa]